MNEAETRAEHIDPALQAAGWGVVEGSRIRREYPITLGRLEGYGRRAKSLSADYVLEYRNTKLAVVEAKAWDEELTEGVAQAKNYAGKLAVRFAFSTNGRGIYQIDMVPAGKYGDGNDASNGNNATDESHASHSSHRLEGEVPRFPTPDELWNLTFAKANAWRDRFATVHFEDRGGYFQGRYYQDIAIDRVLEAIAEGKDRILLTLATGTGKTFIAFQLAWKLFHSRWNLTDWKAKGEPSRRPRILFLADRNILADQAYNAFSAFPEDALVRIEPADIRKKGKVPKNGSLFFTIFQTFMASPASGAEWIGGNRSTSMAAEPQAYFGDYPQDFFDFIVIDECHRGGANDESNWRGILEYFAPAVHLGLTATPKRKDNADTYRYFGEPVFIYSLKDGINDGFLTPFKVKQISTTLDEYVYTSDDTVIEGEIEAGKVYEEKDFNKIIEIKQREQHRVQLFMEMIDQREKTLVFCATQVHALAVRDLINQMKTSKDPNYCQRVTANDGALGEQHLRDFQDNEKSIPTILTTSQKLSTGVDARNIRNIVLMRPINSIIEFKQIIGRGTRLYDGKDYFTIYDFVKAHHHFSDPEWDGEPLEEDIGAIGMMGSMTPIAPIRPIDPGSVSSSRRKKAKVKLADGKERTIQHMMMTSFWHPDGTPMSAQQFMELLFGKLPEFFKDEAELPALWSAPDTRSKLLEGLAENGFGLEQMTEMQRIIDAEKSDLFDVLACVAYALPTLTREQRATTAKVEINAHFDTKQQAFLDFVLAHYVSEGVQERASFFLLLELRIRPSCQGLPLSDSRVPDSYGRPGGESCNWRATSRFSRPTARSRSESCSTRSSPLARPGSWTTGGVMVVAQEVAGPRRPSRLGND
ncbi:MAG: DEAD/DEAH box helicase family protein [Planctomycetota bacterium]|nr:DEAD/DEAH box helicase family protein [Planctomycetota bacterium]